MNYRLFLIITTIKVFLKCLVTYLLIRHFNSEIKSFTEYIELKISSFSSFVIETQKEFEYNTKKYLEKKVSILENTVNRLNEQLTYIIQKNKENTIEFDKFKEKNKINYEKYKLLEKKITMLENILLNPKSVVNPEPVQITIQDIDILNVVRLLSEKNELLEKKIEEKDDNIQLILSRLEILENKNSVFNKKFSIIERKISSLEKENIEIKKKNSDLEKMLIIKDVIDNVIEDVIKISNKSSQTITDCFITKNSLSEIFHNQEQKRYIKTIDTLLEQEKILIKRYCELWIKFNKVKGKSLIFPDGFNTLYYDDGKIKIKDNTLHLLSKNYIHTNRLIEIVFAKFFIDKINKDLLQFYINDKNPKILLVHRFDIRTDIPIVCNDDIELLNLENQCLRGIYYVMIKRKTSFERFLSTYETIITNM